MARIQLVPHSLGPTWSRNADGSWRLPEHTLGWHIIGWCATYLNGPDGGPWRFTAEQARFVLWMYAVDDRGRFLFRDIVLQRMKGWGKDPLAAVICAVEFVGPCRFERWSDEADVADGVIHEVGQAIGRPIPDAWVQIAAVSKDQTKNTMMALNGLFNADAISEFRIDHGKEIIYAFGAMRRIEVISTNSRALEGNRPTFVVRGEPHHWIKANNGLELAAVIRRNLGKRPGGQARGLSITNAYRPGEKSFAEKQRLAYLEALDTYTPDTMYDSLEAPLGTSLLPQYTDFDDEGNPRTIYTADGQAIPPSEEVAREHVKRILELVRGDAHWLDLERLVADILDPEADAEESKRFYFNSVALADDASFDPDHIRAAIAPDVVAARHQRTGLDDLRVGWRRVSVDDEVVVFGDGSKSNDSTGLVACRLSDGYVFTLGVWQKPPGERGRNWLAPREEVDARMREAMSRFNVVAIFFDPSHAKDEDAVRYWDTMVDGWHQDWGDKLQVWAVQSGDARSAVSWDMTSPTRQQAFVQAVERFTDELESRVFEHDGHPALIDHLINCRRNMTLHGLSVSKRSRGSSEKIDLGVCAIGARMLRRLVLNKGLEESGSGTVWGRNFG